MNSPDDILRHHFGHHEFRGSQRAIINHLLAGRHTLVIMPTGGGKSLCYQIPALLLAEANRPPATDLHRPLTIVLSPLIALMKDQVVRGELPAALRDQTRLAEKICRDRENLYALVQYVQHDGDRMKFLHDYFGLPYPTIHRSQA